MGPGQFFGEHALVNKAKQVVSVVTTSTTLVYIIRGEDFFKMVLSHQPTLQKLKKYCQNKQEWMMQRAGSMSGTLQQYRETQAKVQAKQKGKSKGSKGAKGMGVGDEGERGGREKEARRACASEVSEEGWHWGRRACMWYGAPWAVHSCGAWAMHAPSTLAEEARRTRDKDAVRMRMQGRTW